jgi:nitrite reductase/ring-hydroxylating ferredoxin subunit
MWCAACASKHRSIERAMMVFCSIDQGWLSCPAYGCQEEGRQGMAQQIQHIRVGTVEEVKQRRAMVIAGSDRPVAIFYHQEHIYAVDNRCPHMGFPLHRGTTDDGILTCHWHHARFDLASGCAFDLWADDIPTYPVEIRHGEVWVTVQANGTQAADRWQRRLRQGMEQSLRLVQVKAIIGLLDAGVSLPAILTQAGLYGVQHRQAGWSSGLTILTAMGNSLPHLRGEERIFPLYQGVLHVARDCSDQPPQVLLQPLAASSVSLPTLKRWLRRWVEVRDRDGAERCVLTALALGASAAEMTDMLMAAATDHFYLDGGHSLDFINKSFELLHHIGWEHASTVLPSVLGHLTTAERSEERNAWRHPVDLVALVHDVYDRLPALCEAGRNRSWHGGSALVDTLLGDSPHDIVTGLCDSLRQGATPLELARALVCAACRRIVHFHTRNEFSDWIAVLHTFTYSQALYQALTRAPSLEMLRGVWHGAMRVYLDRFLNIPAAPLPVAHDSEPHPVPGDEFASRFLALLDTQQQVDTAGAMVYQYLTAGAPLAPLYRTLITALVREDADFHSFQMLEAALQQHSTLGNTVEGHLMLVAAARFLAAHAPTQRELLQTATIALRLHRGDALWQD